MDSINARPVQRPQPAHAQPALVAATPELAERAAQLAQQFHLTQQPNEHDFVLELTPQGLQLRWRTHAKVSPLLLDFCHGKQAWRRQVGGGRSEAIVRALGVTKGRRPSVLDATAGLGRDAMVLANAGCAVHLLERNPAVHALLHDAIERAAADAEIGPWVSERVKVLNAGSILQSTMQQAVAANPPQAIYLDPMFPHREKSAAVKKDMQMLQQLAGADPDSDQLLPRALELASHRVVVKRPAKAPYLAGHKPSAEVATKGHRFDIYVLQAYA